MFRNLWVYILACELALQHGDGSRFYARLDCLCMKKEGTESVVRIVLTDITQNKQAEEYFQRFFNLSPDLVCIASADGHLLKINPMWQETLGYTEQEILSHPFFDLIHPDDMAATMKEIERQLAGKATVQFINRYRCKDGSYRWLEWKTTPAVEGLLFASARDITERKKVEDKLVENELHFRAITQSANDAIITGAGAGNIVDWNAAAGRLFGYTEAEIIGQPMAVLMPERFRSLHSAGLARVVDGGTPHIIGKTVGFTGLRKDGSEFPLEISLAQWQAAEGQFFTAIIRDITERRQAEESLKSMATKFRTVFESSSDAIVLFDGKGFLDCNPSTLRMFGCPTHDEFIGKHPGELSPPTQPGGEDSMSLANEHITTAFKNGNTLFEWTHRRLDGADFSVEVLLTAMELDGKPVLQATVRDITKRKQAEETLREKEHLLSESQRIAHVGSWHYELTGQLTWSDEAYRIYGASPDTFTPNLESLMCLIHPDDRQAMQSWIVSCAEDKKPDPLEFRIRLPDGTERVLSGYGELQHGAGNRQNHLIGIVHDITERKRAHASEERYRRLFESAKDGILILDAETGMVVDANPFMTEIMGYSHEELLGKHIWDLGFLKNVAANKEKFLELQQQEYVRYEDLPLETAQGKTMRVEFVSNVYLVGNTRVIQCNIRDITERKHAEDSLRKLSLAVEQSPSSIVITDLDANIEYVNESFVKTTGYSLAEVVGQNPRLLHSGKTPKATYDDLWAHLTRGEVWKGEFINRRKDGSEYIESVLISPVRKADGLVTNYLAIKEDITERKRMEQALRENEARYRRITEGLTDYQYTVRIENGITVETTQSPACVTVTGYTPEEFAANPYLWFQMIAPEDRELVMKHVHQMLAGKDIPPIEHRIIKKNGETRWISDTTILFKDASGKLLSYDGVIKDITERMLMEEKLLVNKNRLKEAQRIGKLGSLDWDLISNKIELSDEALELYGLDPARKIFEVEEIKKWFFNNCTVNFSSILENSVFQPHRRHHERHCPLRTSSWTENALVGEVC